MSDGIVEFHVRIGHRQTADDGQLRIPARARVRPLPVGVPRRIAPQMKRRSIDVELLDGERMTKPWHFYRQRYLAKLRGGPRRHPWRVADRYSFANQPRMTREQVRFKQSVDGYRTPGAPSNDTNHESTEVARVHRSNECDSRDDQSSHGAGRPHEPSADDH